MSDTTPKSSTPLPSPPCVTQTPSVSSNSSDEKINFQMLTGNEPTSPNYYPSDSSHLISPLISAWLSIILRTTNNALFIPMELITLIVKFYINNTICLQYKEQALVLTGDVRITYPNGLSQILFTGQQKHFYTIRSQQLVHQNDKLSIRMVDLADEINLGIITDFDWNDYDKQHKEDLFGGNISNRMYSRFDQCYTHSFLSSQKFRYNYYVRWNFYKRKADSPKIDKELTTRVRILQYQLKENDIVSIRVYDGYDRLGYFINNQSLFFFDMNPKLKYYYIMSFDWGANVGKKRCKFTVDFC